MISAAAGSASSRGTAAGSEGIQWVTGSTDGHVLRLKGTLTIIGGTFDC